MKRRFVFLLILLALGLSACGKRTPAQTLPVETAAETTVAAETEPELEYVTAQVNGIPAVLKTLSRGDRVDTVESFDEKHYVVKLDMGYGLVEKNLIRLSSEPAYEPWTGYAYPQAEVFDNYRLAGTPVKKLPSNTKVEVLDDLGWCVLVSCENETGYMKPEGLARKPQSSTPAAGESAGEDGGEIWMQHAGNLTLLSTITPQKGNVSGSATVLADGTQVSLGYFERGDKIPVVKQSIGGENLTVCLDGLYAQVSGTYVQTADDSAYTPWEGRSRQIVPVYKDFWMLGSPIERLNANTGLKVLYELEHCYFVEVHGTMGYMKKDGVAPAADAPKETVPEVTIPVNGNVPKETLPVGGSNEASKPTEESQPPETKPTEPEPTESNPTEPQSTEPQATEPQPTEPQPTETTAPTQAPDESDPEWSPPIL